MKTTYLGSDEMIDLPDNAGGVVRLRRCGIAAELGNCPMYAPIRGVVPTVWFALHATGIYVRRRVTAPWSPLGKKVTR